MDPALARKIGGRLSALEATRPRVRMGVVTDDDPLTVALGGAAETYAYADIKAVGIVPPMGAQIVALQWGQDLIVLGVPVSVGGDPSGLGSMAFQDGADVDITGGSITGVTGVQPSDTDLTQIAALTTTTFGRARLTDSNAAAARSALVAHEAMTLGTRWPVDMWTSAASVVSSVQFTYYTCAVEVLAPGTITGVEYQVGAAANGVVRAALYGPTGTRLVNDTTNLNQSAAGANTRQLVPFDSTQAVTPGIYHVSIGFNNTASTFIGGDTRGLSNSTVSASIATPTSITPPTGHITAPRMHTY